MKWNDMELHIYTTESGIPCYNAGNSSSMCPRACVTDHMLPISRAINKLLISHSMPLTNGYLIIIYELPVFLKAQVPVVEMQKGVLCWTVFSISYLLHVWRIRANLQDFARVFVTDFERICHTCVTYTFHIGFICSMNANSSHCLKYPLRKNFENIDIFTACTRIINMKKILV